MEVADIFCSYFNPFQPSIAFHMETSHLFCSTKQVTGFCMKTNTGLKRVKTLLLSKTFLKLVALIALMAANVRFSNRLTHFSPVLCFTLKPVLLFCRVKLMTDFYMKRNTGLKWVKDHRASRLDIKP